MSDHPGTSSADPFVLARYASGGTAMGTSLQGTVGALGEAAEALAAAGEAVPGLADLVAACGDLAGDWYHLDRFAGDVAAGFLAAIGPSAAAHRAPFVVTLDDQTVGDLGQVGLADRDRAVAEAERLAATYAGLLDDLAGGGRLVHDPPADGGLSLPEAERLATMVEAYRLDPAFAVTFARALGVDGIVGLRGLYEGYARQARAADRPRGRDWSDDATRAWVDAQMVGVAGVLTTAMGTRRQMPSSPPDTGPAGSGAADHLDEAWVERFERYGGDALDDYSLLVLAADLPPDVLVAVGDQHLGDHFGHDDRGPDDESGLASAPTTVTHADRTIATAIAADPDASAGWLASDGITSGTPNLALVLTRSTPADIHSAFVDIVGSALTHPTDPAGRGALMEQAIRLVGHAEAGGIAAPRGLDDEPDDGTGAMRRALGRGAAASMGVVDALVTDGWAGAHLAAPPPADAYVAHDFLREVMVDPDAADAIAGGYERYALARLAALPPAGSDGTPRDGLDDRSEALRELGAVEGVVIHAENNALLGSVEQRIARQRSHGRVVDGVVEGAAFAAGFVPVYGQGVAALDAAATLAGVSAGGLAFPGDDGDLTRATTAAQLNHLDANVNFATLLSLADGAGPPPVTSVADLADDERQAFVDWVVPHYRSADHGLMQGGYADTVVPFGTRR